MNGASTVRARLRRAAIRAMGRSHRLLYRASRGHILGTVAGMPVLLLTTTGRRSGKARTTPLTFFRDGGDLVVIASNGGDDRPPAWWLNLRQQPRALVEIGTARLGVVAADAPEHERERLWSTITATHSGYADYQQRTTRRIPVVLLSSEGAQERPPSP